MVTRLARRTKVHAGLLLITTASNSLSGTGVGIALGLNTTIVGTARNTAMTVVMTVASQRDWCHGS